MPSTNLNIRIDSEVKQADEKVFSGLGLNLSSAINIFLRQAIRVNGIPFELHNGEQIEVQKAPERKAKSSENNVPRIIPSENTKARGIADSFSDLFDVRDEGQAELFDLRDEGQVDLGPIDY